MRNALHLPKRPHQTHETKSLPEENHNARRRNDHQEAIALDRKRKSAAAETEIKDSRNASKSQFAAFSHGNDDDDSVRSDFESRGDRRVERRYRFGARRDSPVGGLVARGFHRPGHASLRHLRLR